MAFYSSPSPQIPCHTNICLKGNQQQICTYSWHWHVQLLEFLKSVDLQNRLQGFYTKCQPPAADKCCKSAALVGRSTLILNDSVDWRKNHTIHFCNYLTSVFTSYYAVWLVLTWPNLETKRSIVFALYIVRIFQKLTSLQNLTLQKSLKRTEKFTFLELKLVSWEFQANIKIWQVLTLW